MVTLYHGTSSGPADENLADFLENGVATDRTADPWDQRAGFYLSATTGWAQMFARDRYPTTSSLSGRGYDPVTLEDYLQDIQERNVFETQGVDQAEYYAKLGTTTQGQILERGAVLEFDVELDAVNWDFDHEMSYGYSMKLLHQMRDQIAALTAESPNDQALREEMLKGFDGAGITPTFNFDIDQDYLAGQMREGFFVMNPEAPLGLLPSDKATAHHFKWPAPESELGDRRTAHLLERLHDMLAEQFPEEYQAAKLSMLEEMVAKNCSSIKYVGEEPLFPAQINVRNAKTPVMPIEADQPFEGWDVMHRSHGRKILDQRAQTKEAAQATGPGV